MNDPSEIVKLQHEVQTLQRRLDGAYAELQDLLYTISHDFKGPMRAIMSSSMILMEDYAPKLDGAAKEELKRQSESARKLNKMLEELLKLSRLSRREVQRVEFDLGELLLIVADRCGIARSQVEVEGPLGAFADRELTALLFMNLLDNALKFAKAGTSVRLILGQDEAGYFLKDDGIGLLPEQASRVFHPFERLNGDAYLGMGMGLTQCKRIVAMHDGAILVEGAPNEGITVRFTLEG